MKKVIIPIIVSGIVVLITSLAILYTTIQFFPFLMEDYFNAAFRASSYKTDWLFYAHPFVLSGSLKWFWVRYKDVFKGNDFLRAIEVGLVYGVVALLPVLWLTFSAINISVVMVITWLGYGIIQATLAGFVFSKFDK